MNRRSAHWARVFTQKLRQEATKPASVCHQLPSPKLTKNRKKITEPLKCLKTQVRKSDPIFKILVTSGETVGRPAHFLLMTCALGKGCGRHRGQGKACHPTMRPVKCCCSTRQGPAGVTLAQSEQMRLTVETFVDCKIVMFGVNAR